MSNLSPPQMKGVGKNLPAADDFDETYAAEEYDASFDGADAQVDDDNYDAAAAPLPSGAPIDTHDFATDATAHSSVFSQLLQAQLETNKLLSHVVASNAQNDAHRLQLKALATGANTVTHEVNVYFRGSLQEIAAGNIAPKFVVPAGSLPHSRGTILEATVIDGRSAFPVSFMMDTSGISNLAPPSVVSPSGVKGVCMIDAKCKTIRNTSIVSAVESQAVRQFAVEFPNYTAENLRDEITANVVKSKDGSKTMFLVPYDHPVAVCIQQKFESKNISMTPFWSEVVQKYQFAESEVNLAVNEIKKKLVSEDTTVSLDNISFPLKRAIISEANAKDKSVNAWSNQWLDTEEITAQIKSGHPEAELKKTYYVQATLRITYAPAINSARK